MKNDHRADAAALAGTASSWLAAIIESSQDAIVSKDLNGTVTSWNAAAERIFGYTAAEMIGAPILRIIPDDLHREEDHILSHIRAGRKVEHFQTVRRRKDGTLVHISVSISPVRDASGRVIGASKIARDITAQRDADRTKALLAAIVESSDDAIISKDLCGKITSWNRAAERLFGYTAEEMIGTPLLRIIPPERRDEEHLILAKMRAGERVDHFPTVRMTRDGGLVDVSITISPVRNADGTIIGVSKIARDLTARKEADRTRAMLAAIVTDSSDAIISKTLEGVVTSWNPAAERLYGFTAAQMIGQSILKIVPPHLHREEDEILAKVRAGERLDHFETVRMRKDGRFFEVAITVSPVRDSLGRVIGASKIARDITEQREERRMKEQFLALLAHELRNPLAPLSNTLALIARPDTSEEQRQKAQTIAHRQVQHMARLLDDLLDVSRITTGRVELRRAKVELRSLVEEAVDAVRPLYSERQHALDVHQADHPIWLDADPVRITQIFVNLLANAAKYTDPGGHVHVDVRADESFAAVTVRDDGIGFDPLAKDRLFTLFSRGENAGARPGGGLGIGLALVREFVERHGGRIDARSAGAGQGSCFTVRLPVISAPV